MRVDFAEERRWKRLAAREFAYQVVEWHLATIEEKARSMVGGRGWGQSDSVGIPGHSGQARMAEKEPAEADVEDVDMLQPEAEDLTLEDSGQVAAQVLEDMKVVTHEIGDDMMGEEIDGAQAAGDVDADGEADAEGEADADGEVDAEGESDLQEGFVGLAGEIWPNLLS
jgi:chromatin modification-related protein VID21